MKYIIILSSLMSYISYAKSVELSSVYVQNRSYILRSALSYNEKTKQCEYITEVYDNKLINILLNPVSYRTTVTIELDLCQAYNLIK